MTEDKGLFLVLEVRDRFSKKVKSEIRYEFLDISGTVLQTGKCASGDEIDFADNG